MDCARLEKIARESFQSLFRVYGFKVVFCKEGERESALLFAESNDCRIRFMSLNYDDELDVAFGSRNARLEWSPSDPVYNDFQWFSLPGLMIFLDEKPLDLADILAKVHQTYQTRGTPTSESNFLEQLSADAQPYLPRILTLFADAQFNSFRKEYETFRKRQQSEFERQWQEKRE